MDFSVEKIWEEFENNRINKSTAIELFKTLIENSANDEIRLTAINRLVKIFPLGKELYKILENLIVSDDNVQIRYIAIKYIGDLFLYKAFPLLDWAIKHEDNYNCLIEIVKLLGTLKIKQTKLVLFRELQNFIKKKYINKERRIENKKFKKVLKKLLKQKNYEEFTHDEFAIMLIHIMIISNLFIQYHNVYYEINPQNGLIEKLDLSDMEYEVKGTPSNWKNNIKNLSEILGIEYLDSLHYLDLSNNQIDNITEVIYLSNLTHLILKNNRLSMSENLEYLKNMKKLKYLDLRSNKIVKHVKKNDFDSTMRVFLKDFHTEIK